MRAGAGYVVRGVKGARIRGRVTGSCRGSIGVVCWIGSLWCSGYHVRLHHSPGCMRTVGNRVPTPDSASNARAVFISFSSGCNPAVVGNVVWLCKRHHLCIPVSTARRRGNCWPLASSVWHQYVPEHRPLVWLRSLKSPQVRLARNGRVRLSCSPALRSSRTKACRAGTRCAGAPLRVDVPEVY